MFTSPMKKLIAICLAIVLLSHLTFAIPIKEYKIELKTKEKMILNQYSLEIKDYPDFSYKGYGDYFWVISAGNDWLNYSYFDTTSLVLYDSVNPETGLIEDGGEVETNLTEVQIYIPYHPNADKIDIFKINETTLEKIKILEIDLSRFAKKQPEQNIPSEIETKLKITPTNIEKVKTPQGRLSLIISGIILMVTIISILYLIIRKRATKPQ